MAENDIEHLYSKVNNHEGRLVKIETAQPFLKDILERSVVSTEKLAETMHEVQLSMTNLNSKIEEQAQVMESMKEEFTEAHKQTNEEIVQINAKVDKIDEKSKFDIHLFLKNNWPWIMTLIGLGIFSVAHFVKF